MAYRSLREAALDLERTRQLVRIPIELDPDQELPAIHRRVYAAGGPALWFERVRGTSLPAVSNLFGTLDRARFLFRHTLRGVELAIAAKGDPSGVLRAPSSMWGTLRAGLHALPLQVGTAPVLARTLRVSQLPAIRAWPKDGGAFITLPQVWSEPPGVQDPLKGNLGMYRVQLGGNQYRPDAEVGLHYQIHRGIGPHHAQALARGEPLRVSVFVGGPPAHTVAAVMPLPEGLSELMFAGMLAGRRFRYTRVGAHLVSAEADVCIVGSVDPRALLPEGPFGDHLGYYSLAHPFPVLSVEAVYAREDAMWPFTVVGRPPQEDTVFGQLIHELTAPIVPTELPGLVSMHAVDAAGVHPLMLAVGRERYVPYGPRQPRELLTVAHSILGFGQASLAKYLLVAAIEDDAELRASDPPSFFAHVLSRFDPTRDLHVHTRSTIDTLDYSGTGLNEGSKLVWAAAGPTRRTLAPCVPAWPEVPGFGTPRLILPGIVMVSGPRAGDEREREGTMGRLCDALATIEAYTGDGMSVPLVVVHDEGAPAASVQDFLWVTFTRSNPSHDLHGVGAFIEHKHWGCRGSVVIDARSKSHHADPLEEDPDVIRRLEAKAVRGGPLSGLW